MPRYEKPVDRADANTSHAIMLDLVGGQKSVLDVGCSSGYLARLMRDSGCTVSGVELDPVAAEAARPVLDRLVVGDLAELDLAAELDGARFDAILLGDILEHLVDPPALLRQVVGLLNPGGSVVISVPNITHGSIRLALLQGRWRYTETGLLDSTHLRFWTRASLAQMLREAGLVVAEERDAIQDVHTTEVQFDQDTLPPGIIDWVRHQPDALVYQYVLRAVRDDVDGLTARALAQSAELGRQLDKRQQELDEAQHRLAEVEARRDQAEQEVDEARARISAITSTRSYRALEPVRRVVRRARRATGRSE
jgi:2-polyprenyl-3-methyl-5-hydroxy-6-metoxy-1,4-benzoquinol methylase